ncbi:hypothetical protein SLEP1_g16428 [Rubroshorea leprosula]|uniref:Uncharacterized protein n=1 Tax=Rubroshorea leprosula TaxID=152421 RepID=A0AAV5J1B2_9ROSI|nr:hypothetical protein SLEP1_g16428 [Rubroshorea leprosula]
MTIDLANRKEFVIRIDGGSSQSNAFGGGNKIWGDSDYDFLGDSYKLMKKGKKENVDVTGSSSGGNYSGEDFDFIPDSFGRIQESVFNQHIIKALSGTPLTKIQKIEEEEERIANEVRNLQNAGATIPPGGDKEDQGISIDQLHNLNPKNVSAWNMKGLMNLIRQGALSTLDQWIQDSAYGDESTEIRSELM